LVSLSYIAGVDGCKDGWVITKLFPNGKTIVDIVNGSISSLSADVELQIAVIDIPIGLPDSGSREADQQARALLGSRGCCVFPAPIRPLLGLSDYDSICAKRFEIERKRVSKQAAALIPKIAEVDHIVRHQSLSRICEGHPEVSFAAMNDGKPIAESKKSAAGRDVRISVISNHFPDARNWIERHHRFREDIIDAYSLLWTATRIREGKAVRLPEIAPHDKFGLAMQISY
jgi:predicted RNase H-like nuclease